MTADGLAVLIAGGGIALVLISSMVLTYLVARDQAARDALLACRIEEMATKVEVVHRATNSLVTRLVESTDKEAFARGEKSTKDRRDAP